MTLGAVETFPAARPPDGDWLETSESPAPFRVESDHSSILLADLLRIMAVDPSRCRTLLELSVLMHRNIASAIRIAQSPPLDKQRLPQGIRSIGWRCLEFAAVMCAIVGCATPPSARDASDLSACREAEPNAGHAAHGLAIGRTVPTDSASGDVAVGSAAAASLPWLSTRHVSAAVRAHREDFQACQALGDVLSQREDGSVTVGWAVRADGSVHQVTLGRSTFRDASINACVLGVARKVSFPASAAPATVSWTVQFRGASHEPLAAATSR